MENSTPRTVKFSKRPNSLEGLKYLAIIWCIVGTNPPRFAEQGKKRFLYYLYSGCVNSLCSIYFSATMLINLFFIDSYKDLVANLSLSISICMSGIKQLAVLKYRQQLLKSHGFLKLLDERCSGRENECKRIWNAVRSAQLFCLFFPFYVFCGCGFGYNGWSHHQLIYNAWYPNFFTTPEHNYLAAFVLQFCSQIYIGLQSVFNDIYPLCYLSLMIGHLESLADRIASIGWQKGCENHDEENIEELKNCVKDHKNLLQ